MTDYTLDATVYQMFTTRSIAGVPTALAGTPVVSAYENDSAIQITDGITLDVDHDGVTGLNLLTIAATTANGFESGKDYNLVITTGTVDSVSAVGEVVGAFSIGRSAAAVDLANATDGLGALKTLIDALNDFDPSATNVSVGSIAANAINAASINAGAITSGKFAAGAITATSIAASALNGKGNWNIGKTGYTLTQAFPANFSTLAITATTGRVTAGTVIDKAGYSISGTLTTLDGLNNLSAADVNAEVDTAISDAALATAASLATVDSNVDAILADTNELQTNQGDWATATGFATAAAITALNDLSAADVNSEVDTAIADAGLATSAALATVDANVDAILVDTGTTLPATLSGLSTFDATTDTVDVGAIDGSTTAAARLSDSAETMVLGAAITGTLSTTEMSTDLTETTNNHYNGRVIIWKSGVLTDQATNITGYDGTTKVLTFTATTEAPANTDTFIIV